MPRLPGRVLHNAGSFHPFLPLLLRACRDVPSAQNELRWLREHVQLKVAHLGRRQRNARESAFRIRRREQASRSLNYFRRQSPRSFGSQCLSLEEEVLRRWCLERSRGMPLQYILGSQPFGAVDVLCKRGVLIPRPETEAYTVYIANYILRSLDKHFSTSITTIPHGAVTSIKILDLCTGTGCIPLLFHALLHTKVSHLKIVGVDISPAAIALANKNLDHNIAEGHLSPAARSHIRFVKGDIFDDKAIIDGTWDVVISNPPYISPKGFNTNTSRSVRNYEPKSALVPPGHYLRHHHQNNSHNKTDDDAMIGDSFYPQILKIAAQVRAKMVLMEISDLIQAERVMKLGVVHNLWLKCEIWPDWPDEAKGEEDDDENDEDDEKEGENEENEENGEDEDEDEKKLKKDERWDEGELFSEMEKFHTDPSKNRVRIKGAKNSRSVFFSQF